MGTLWLESEDHHTQYLAQFPYQDICNSTEFKWSAAEKHFPDDKSGKIEATFPCMYMMKDGSGFLTCGEKMECPSHVYLECGSDNENTTEPDWELFYAGLSYLDPESNEIITGGSEGILGVAVQDRNNPENYVKGTVCDDSFNSHAANLSCQYLGYDYAARWGSKPNNSDYIPVELLDKYDIPIVVGWVHCDNTSSHITECETSIMESHGCSRSNNIWLQCQDFDNGWTPTGAGLFTVNDKTGNLERGNEGQLLVSVVNGTDYRYGTVCDDSFNDHAANLACQYIGYKYAEAWGSGPNYIPIDYLEQNDVPIVIDDLYCDEWKTSIMECVANIMEEHDCIKSESLWLKCSHGEEKDPIWDLVSAALYTYDPESGELKTGREGLLGVAFEDRNHQEEPVQGTVCGTSITQHIYHTAYPICQYLGYDFPEELGTDPQNSKYIPTHILEKHGVQIVVSDLQCDESNNNITECEANIMGSHNCSRSDNLWLKCAKRGNDWKPITAGLYSVDEKTGEVKFGREGLLLVGLENTVDDGFIYGTVCNDSFNSHAANLGCQYLGYDYAEDWGSGFKYFPESVLEAAGLEIVIDDLYCDEEKKEIMECEANVMEKHDCSRRQSLWLKCSEGGDKKPDWDLVNATLYKYDAESGEVKPNRGEGLLGVALADLKQEEEPVEGTVCGTTFKYQEANLACQYLGYDHVKDWGTDPQNSNNVPESMLEKYGVPIVVEGVRCDDNATSIKDCDANVMEAHDCPRKENLWLKCISEDEEEEEEEEEQGIELEFGGAKLKLNLSKFRGKLFF